MKNLLEVPVKKEHISRKALPLGVAKVLKRLHFPVDVILLCVRWYVAYSLSLRNLEEMMEEHGIELDHSTVHRWGFCCDNGDETRLIAILRNPYITSE
ncbi:hypothetical protein BGV48_23170 [Burkholderia ubonensis]|nr:hypothetical protein BGV48_23170 [Burkholderia ubonensis]